VPACVKNIANYGWYEHPFGNQRCEDRQKAIIASGYPKTREVDRGREVHKEAIHPAKGRLAVKEELEK